MRVAQARLALNQDGQPRIGDEPPMTQGELGDLIGCHRVTVNKIEAGAARVSLGTLERLAAVLTRSREYLLGEPELVDEFELARERLTHAATKIADGLEEASLVIDLMRELRSGSTTVAAGL